ncbi:uncharacterized, partial [Tachysurus ichikawai]
QAWSRDPRVRLTPVASVQTSGMKPVGRRGLHYNDVCRYDLQNVKRGRERNLRHGEEPKEEPKLPQRSDHTHTVL